MPRKHEPKKIDLPYGEGSIYHRASDDRWCYAVPEEGRKSPRVFTARTQEEVYRKYQDYQADLKAGRIPGTRYAEPARKVPTVAEYLKEWLQNTVKHSVAASTYDTYSLNARVHILPALGDYTLDALTQRHMRDYVARKVEEGLGRATIDMSGRVLGPMLDQARTDGFITANPWRGLKLPRKNKQERLYYNEEQARAFLIAVKGHHDEYLLTVAIMLGLRQGELLGLRWIDIDFERRTLTVAQALRKLQGHSEVAEPKWASRRTIVMPAGVIAALHGQRAQVLACAMQAGEGWQDNAMVFPTPEGAPRSHAQVYQAYRRILKAHKLPPLPFHGLRHTAATMMLMHGVPIKTVSEILGHRSITITLDLYGHVLESSRQEAANVIDALYNAK